MTQMPLPPFGVHILHHRQPVRCAVGQGGPLGPGGYLRPHPRQNLIPRGQGIPAGSVFQPVKSQGFAPGRQRAAAGGHQQKTGLRAAAAHIHRPVPCIVKMYPLQHPALAAKAAVGAEDAVVHRHRLVAQAIVRPSHTITSAARQMSRYCPAARARAVFHWPAVAAGSWALRLVLTLPTLTVSHSSPLSACRRRFSCSATAQTARARLRSGSAPAAAGFRRWTASSTTGR